MSSTTEFSYLVISDIHLGHPRNKTKEIIANLDTFFDNYTAKSQFVNVKIIFLAGDVFDSLLDLSGDDVHEINLWFGRLMDFCSRYNIKLRVLEGTPSHDWKQSKASETVFSLIEKPFDFRYIDTLHIEHIEDMGIHVLYVPDEWNPSTEETFRQVQKLMETMGLQEVDIACMHGMFRYQAPPMAKNIPLHDEASYLGIVKHFINIGHVHTFSYYDKIIAEGSFDRLAQGEEEPKGGVLCTVSAKYGNSFQFIENKGAKIFKTIEIRVKDLEKSLAQINKILSKLPHNSYIRIKAAKDHPLYVAFDELKIKFPMYIFSKASLEEDIDANAIAAQVVQLDEEYIPITINETNIVPLIMEEVKTKYDLPVKKMELLGRLLEDIKSQTR